MPATVGSFNPTTEHLMAGETGVLTAATNLNNSSNCAATKVLTQEKLKAALKIKSVVLSIEQRGELGLLQI